MNQRALLGFPGRMFLRETRRADKLLLTWTVNDPRWMEWCLRKNVRKGGCARTEKGSADGDGGGEDDEGVFSAAALIDGVITDDPKLYLEVCSRFEDELDGTVLRRELGVVGSVRDAVSAAWTSVVFQLLVMGYYLVRRAQGRFDYLEDRRTLDGPVA